jgi:hypothetical protein
MGTFEEMPPTVSPKPRLIRGVCKVRRSEIAGLETLHPDSDLELLSSIVAECVRQFWVDCFGVPSFDPDIFDEKSLVRPGHVSSTTPFINLSI